MTDDKKPVETDEDLFAGLDDEDFDAIAFLDGLITSSPNWDRLVEAQREYHETMRELGETYRQIIEMEGIEYLDTLPDEERKTVLEALEIVGDDPVDRRETTLDELKMMDGIED